MSMLRSIREKKGFTLGQLAGRSGISTKVLADYEEGQHSISLVHAKLLAKALWVGVEELIPPPGAIQPSPASPVTSSTSAPGISPVSQDVTTPHVATERQAPVATRSGDEIITENVMIGGADQLRISGAGEQQPQRAPKAASVAASPITEGQLQELAHLAVRLQIDNTQLEERVGKSLSTLKKAEAKEWIKKLRGMADEVAPGTKVRYGKWPEAKEDREALYLREQKEFGAAFLFKLFNGETFTGVVSDFTTYTITVKLIGKITGKQDDEDVVLRKLAIAYYRRLAPGEEKKVEERSTQGENEDAPSPSAHNHDRDDHHQPLDKGIDSDHAGTPAIPEEDNMDKDRGA